jgi:hypothetical protein
MYGSSMTFDSNRGVAVFFGGLTGYNGFHGDTWEWDGTWIRRTTHGPSPRSAAAIAYDKARGVTVLFGGATAQGSLSGETWEWNGATWVRRATTGPWARSRAAMAYDSIRRVTVLFGGSGSGDTWEWDGGRWTQRSNSGPAARELHSVAFDPARGVTVLFGGRFLNTSYGDTWEWNGAQWTQRTGPGPSPRLGHTMIYDEGRSACVMLGGAQSLSSPAINEMWQWEGSAWTQLPLNGPPARVRHVMVYDPVRSSSVVFGGATESSGAYSLSDTWELTGLQWTNRTIGRPHSRRGSAITQDTARETSVICGGTSNSYPYLTDAWERTSAVWVQRPNGPQRQDAGMAYDEARHVSLLFGGSYYDPGPGLIYPSGETWSWDGTVWIRRVTPGPQPRFGHSMAYDSRRAVIVLFGGGRDFASYADTWVWSGSTWEQRNVTGPSAGGGHSMAYDAARGVTVLFGGQGGTIHDTWEWDGEAWANRTPVGPSPNRGPMAYDSDAGAIVLCDDAPVGDPSLRIWTWNGAQWARSQTSIDPFPRAVGANMVYNNGRHRLVLFGGSINGTDCDETWEYGQGCRAPLITTQPAPQAIRPGVPLVFEVQAAGADAVSFQWRRNGQNLSDDGHVSGCTTGVLTIQQAVPTDVGWYSCVVSSQCAAIASTAARASTCYPNCDQSTLAPVLNVLDFNCFLQRFIDADALPLQNQIRAYANCDYSTTPPVLNVSDFLCFMENFAAGCP